MRKLILIAQHELFDGLLAAGVATSLTKGGAIEHCGRPEIFNSDHGSQFTSEDITSVLRDNESKRQGYILTSGLFHGASVSI